MGGRFSSGRPWTTSPPCLAPSTRASGWHWGTSIGELSPSRGVSRRESGSGSPDLDCALAPEHAPRDCYGRLHGGEGNAGSAETIWHEGYQMISRWQGVRRGASAPEGGAEGPRQG